MPNEKAAQVYEEFLKAREAAIVEEIRRVCGLNIAAESHA
jgi:hypothetical protein